MSRIVDSLRDGTPTIDAPSGLARSRDGVVAVVHHREVIAARGADVVEFLHGQVTQDVKGLADGASTWSFVLRPDGKVLALVRLTRIAADQVIIDTDPGSGDLVLARLNRFKLRVDCDLSIRDDQAIVSFIGPEAASLSLVVSDPLVDHADGPRGARTVIASRIEFDEVVPLAPVEVYEYVRIGDRWPDSTHDFGDGAQVAETALVAKAVCFTKGCYTGQELVERVDSRGGNVPRPLRVLDFGPDAAVAAGSVVEHAEEPVGEVTSVAQVPGHPTLALGPLRRAVAVGDAVSVAGHLAVVTA